MMDQSYRYHSFKVVFKRPLQSLGLGSLVKYESVGIHAISAHVSAADAEKAIQIAKETLQLGSDWSLSRVTEESL